MLNFDFFLFSLFSFLGLFAAFLVISLKNAVHSVLFLVLTFFNFSCLLLLLGAEFFSFLWEKRKKSWTIKRKPCEMAKLKDSIWIRIKDWSLFIPTKDDCFSILKKICSVQLINIFLYVFNSFQKFQFV